jgi:hypothetical protein
MPCKRKNRTHKRKQQENHSIKFSSKAGNQAKFVFSPIASSSSIAPV